MPENKGLDRGGTLGQEGELSPDGGSAGEPIGKPREGAPRREQEPDKNQLTSSICRSASAGTLRIDERPSGKRRSR